MVVRFLFTMGMYVVLAKWMYAEVTRAVPVAKPLLDTVAQAIEIPTHDQWNEEKISAFVDSLSPYVDSVSQVANSSLLNSESDSRFGFENE